MSVPKPSDRHLKLHALAGNWTGQEKLHPSPWDSAGGDAVAECRAKVALNGLCVIMDYVQRRDGHVSYQGHGVYGWDDKRGKYTMYWFDSMSGATLSPASEGTWTGNSLVYVNKSAMGWGRYSYHFESDERYRFTIETSQDGQSWQFFLESVFVKH